MSRESESRHKGADDKLICAYWKIFSTGGCYRQKYMKRMAEIEVQTCLDWLLDQKGVMEQSSFGSNRQSLNEGMKQHSQHRKQLQEYIKQMDKLKIKHALTMEEHHSLYGTYETVQTLAEKKTSCFEVMNELSTLEDHIQGLCTKFDSKAVHLARLPLNNRNKHQRNGLSNESMATTTKNCVSGVRQSWRWMDEVMQCAHVHLANAAAYHEFFHEVEEVDYWMNNTMSGMYLTFSRNKLDGDCAHLTMIDKEMKDTLLAYLRWQSKVDSLFTRARDIVPVHKRISPVTDPCPVLALASYKTNEIEFNEGDTLTLLNNSDKATWRVKNNADQVAGVPAVILLINGPTGDVTDAAVRLKIQLLSLWTTSTKRLGYQMIAFMQIIFRDWTPEEIKALQNMPKANRDELLTILKATEATHKKNWDGYEGFEDLQERITRLQTILEEAKGNNTSHDETSGDVVIQVRRLEDLLNHYQEFWTYWQTYKVVTEILGQPKYILVCDKWDELKYKSTAHFIRFWDTNLQMPADGGKSYNAESAVTLYETPKSPLGKPSIDDTIQPASVDEVMTAKSADKTDSTITDALSKLKNSGLKGAGGDWSSSEMTQQQAVTSQEVGEQVEEWSSTDVTELRRRQQLTTDEVVSSTEEVRHTFIITSVVDPRTQDYISLTEAVLAGIIDQAEGRYINIVTGENMSLQTAMAQGEIAVEFKSQQKIREETSSYGIITIKTTMETRPYTILRVIDPKTEEEMSTEVAYNRGILSRTQPTYKTETGDDISVIDAIYNGLIKAEFHGEEAESDIEETKTYAINAVVDQKRKEKVSFHEALQNGLLDGEEGVYFHNVTRERIPIMEAIMKGFLKAKLISDTSNLDIDPTNTIVVRNLSIAKEKILRAVRVARAFRSNIPAMNGN